MKHLSFVGRNPELVGLVTTLIMAAVIGFVFPDAARKYIFASATPVIKQVAAPGNYPVLVFDHKNNTDYLCYAQPGNVQFGGSSLVVDADVCYAEPIFTDGFEEKP